MTDLEKEAFRNYVQEVLDFLSQEFPSADVKVWVSESRHYVLGCFRDKASVTDCARNLRPEVQSEITQMIDELLGDI